MSQSRLRSAIERSARYALATIGAEAAPAPAPAAAPPSPPPTEELALGGPQRFARNFPTGWFAPESARATDALFERLDPALVSRIQASIDADAELGPAYHAHPDDETVRRRVRLAYGGWLGIEEISQASGLPLAQPPEDVHAMARGPASAAGGLYDADMILAALTSAGVDIDDVDAALDFGCSSGRVLRVLQAAFPRVRWHGCDPNADAIQWASEHLSGIEVFASTDHPPLPLEDGSLDMAYAISIWSHFEPNLGLAWFEEMRRLLRPGGHLVVTTHGITSIAYYAVRELRSRRQSDEIVGTLYREGAWYAPEFGAAGDWGVTNPDWGTAFLTPEWMLANLCPQWRILEFAPGRNQDNQDVYVLERA